MGAAIEARGLRKAYGRVEAVAGVDIAVERGEVFAFLGPNGAGKTTTVELLEGYRRRDGGEVRVLGVDPERAGRDWRARVGVVLQACVVDPELTVSEALRKYAGYYPRPLDVDRVIGLVGLEGSEDVRAARLSGGRQRRLDVGLALVGDPDVLFLDEPTTGFDPSARRTAWEMVRGLRELGKTVFLTTHYMDEAQALADRVAVIREGRIVATGTPATLGGRDREETRISFALPAGVDPATLPAEAGRIDAEGGSVVVLTADAVRALHVLTGWALDGGHELAGLEVARPTLEDVYLDLVGEGP